MKQSGAHFTLVGRVGAPDWLAFGDVATTSAGDTVAVLTERLEAESADGADEWLRPEREADLPVVSSGAKPVELRWVVRNSE